MNIRSNAITHGSSPHRAAHLDDAGHLGHLSLGFIRSLIEEALASSRILVVIHVSTTIGNTASAPLIIDERAAAMQHTASRVQRRVRHQVEQSRPSGAQHGKGDVQLLWACISGCDDDPRHHQFWMLDYDDYLWLGNGNISSCKKLQSFIRKEAEYWERRLGDKLDTQMAVTLHDRFYLSGTNANITTLDLAIQFAQRRANNTRGDIS